MEVGIYLILIILLKMGHSAELIDTGYFVFYTFLALTSFVITVVLKKFSEKD